MTNTVNVWHCSPVLSDMALQLTSQRRDSGIPPLVYWSEGELKVQEVLDFGALSVLSRFTSYLLYLSGLLGFKSFFVQFE